MSIQPPLGELSNLLIKYILQTMKMLSRNDLLPYLKSKPKSYCLETQFIVYNRAKI